MRYVARGTTRSVTEYVTDVTQLETVLTNLNHFTRYYVYVSAKTTPGCGAEASTTFVTLEHGKKKYFAMTGSGHCVMCEMCFLTELERVKNSRNLKF